MCGLTGFLGKFNKEVLDEMNKCITHRGPDAGETVVLAERVHFGHRRLSILDLTPSGAQPMRSHDGRWVIVYNGEIYNFEELKKKLNRQWRGHSDTEVLLEAISEWGIEKTLKESVGMFAFALFDQKSNKLFLGRDRFGEKPLYYGKLKETFFFGSELKSFRPHPDFRPVISKRALRSYFKYNYVPAPMSIYEGVLKLRPGHFLEVDVETFNHKETCYWSLDHRKTFSGDFTSASKQLEELLKQAVARQMVSDVPLGAFLSGGIDSSLIVALMQSQSARPVKTFTIGFQEKSHNEAVFAKEVARHLGTEHTELYVTPQDALNVIPKLPFIYDEPFSDLSQVPTWLLAGMTRKHVTVSLSGDAGDEVFGGYSRYFQANKARKSLDLVPVGARKLAAKAMRGIPVGAWDKISPVSGDKIHKLAGLVNTSNDLNLYLRLITFWEDQENPALSNETPVKYQFEDSLTSFTEKMMDLDTRTYLPDDILVKVDRAAMNVSLETRVPLLDPTVVEFAWSLPLEFKVHEGKGKRILRDVLYRHVPRELIERPKQGFGVPINQWLRKDLKEWASDLLSEEKIKKHGLLDHKKVMIKWNEHQSGSRNWQYLLWDVLMFQAWFEEYHA